MNKEAKWVSKFYFLEVGLKVRGFECYMVFSVPYSLKMRRFNTLAKRYDYVEVDDWLLLDFPTLLCNRLSAGDPREFEVFSVRRVTNSPRFEAPVVMGNSLPDSWLSPFVHLFACTFVNLVLNGK